MKLRLLMTQDCPRQCEGCCNKDWQLDQLPVASASEFSEAQEVLLTGGEPLLYPRRVLSAINAIRQVNFKAKIFVYSAEARDPYGVVIPILEAADGMTFTLHEQDDVPAFIDMTYAIMQADSHVGKSLRLNIFKGISVGDECAVRYWKVKDNMVWMRDCPLPEGEVFMRHPNA